MDQLGLYSSSSDSEHTNSDSEEHHTSHRPSHISGHSSDKDGPHAKKLRADDGHGRPAGYAQHDEHDCMT